MAADPIARLRDGTEVAAWLFKAKPEVWDVIGAIKAKLADAAAPGVTSWEMAASYRVDLVSPGQPCVLWVTGGRKSATTGVWGLGEIACPPWADAIREDGRQRFEVGVDFDLVAEPVRLIELAGDERFARSEIIRAPRVSSPVALTGPELEAIEDAWPGRLPAH